MFDLENMWIEIKCPSCHYQIDIQLVDVKSENVIFCHNCKMSIQLKDDNASTHSGSQKINSALKQIDQLFKNFGR